MKEKELTVEEYLDLVPAMIRKALDDGDYDRAGRLGTKAHQMQQERYRQ